jgi:hypothetical protein
MGYKLRKGSEEVETQSADNRDFLLSRGYELIECSQEKEPKPEWAALIDDEDEKPAHKKGK